MSIFPKRAVPGSTVTIHWNFNIAHLTNVHICPWVRIGVKAPDGKLTMLFENHVLGLPDPEEPQEDSNVLPFKYLNKNLPLLVIADYLSGRAKREVLVQILKNIQSGRHYYFTFQVPKDAPLGKYTLISEVHSSGEVRHSKTAADDFFFVERVSFKDTDDAGNDNTAVIVNHSPEKTPVKIVGCTVADAGKTKTHVNVFEMEALEERRVPLYAPLNFLLYNEEREVVPLQKGVPSYLLRNQQVLELPKEGTTYLLKKEAEEGYTLSEAAAALWHKANGLLPKNELSAQELEAYDELKAEGLIEDIDF